MYYNYYDIRDILNKIEDCLRYFLIFNYYYNTI